MSAAWTNDADKQAGWRHTSDPVALRTVERAESLILLALLLATLVLLGAAYVVGERLPCDRLTAQDQPQADRVCAVQR